jgi:hypothetical protein
MSLDSYFEFVTCFWMPLSFGTAAFLGVVFGWAFKDDSPREDAR